MKEGTAQGQSKKTCSVIYYFFYCLHIIIVKMSTFQQKIMKHAKKRILPIHRRKKELNRNNLEEAQILDLLTRP